jgi:hypothetical protein
MQDFDVESKEWWEVVDKYFAKELEKNLAQHRANERNLKYKLEISFKFFLDFVHGNPTSTKALSQDEEIEVGFNRTTQEKEMQIEEPQDLKGGGHEEKEPQIIQE